jgi:Peptidase family S41
MIKCIPGIFIFPFLLNISASNAQNGTYDSKKNYSVQELKEDFSYFRGKLEKYHPNLYLYGSKKTVDSAFDYLFQSIDTPMTDMEFYRLLNRVHTIIKDGHNFILPGKEALKFINTKRGFLPYALWSNGDKLFCIQNCAADSTITEKTEITSINGIGSKEIIQTLLNLQLRDGYNETLPGWITNQFFRGYYSFIFGQPDEFAIGFKENGTEKMHRIKAMHLDSIRLYRNKKYPFADSIAKVDKGVSLSLNKGLSAATLTIKTFDNVTFKKVFKQKYPKSIRRYFRTIREHHIEHLIIDIRGNRGGNPVYVRQLLSRLLTHRFSMALEARVVRNQEASTWAERNRKKYFPWYGIGNLRSKKNAFTGKLYILIDGGSYSASGQFASVIEKYNRGIFIGEEAGGNKTIIGGFFLPKKNILPNTRIEISPARLLTIYRDIKTNTGHGVMPVHHIIPSIDDLVENRDPAKEFVFKLIKGE